MRGKAALAVLAFVFLAGCGGEEGEESQGGEDVVTVADTGGGGQPATPQCTKTSTCEWGEACIEKSCQIPRGNESKAPAYDFSLKDENSTSASYQQMVTLTEFHGSAVLLYFATSSCAACVADVKVFEGMVAQIEYKGFKGAVKMVAILLPFSGSAIADFTSGIVTPVVLDETGVGVADHYGAGKDSVVLIDAAGYVRYNWPGGLEVRGAAPDKTELNDALIELAQEAI
jgi:hypothetical protein